jgi:hypothetical protein
MSKPHPEEFLTENFSFTTVTCIRGLPWIESFGTWVALAGGGAIFSPPTNLAMCSGVPPWPTNDCQALQPSINYPAASNGVWRQYRMLSRCFQAKQKHETRPKGLGIDPKGLKRCLQVGWPFNQVTGVPYIPLTRHRLSEPGEVSTER